MPPAKRARVHDFARTRTAVLAQSAALREGIGTLTPGQLALPTRLGEWTVRELVAHLALVLGSVARGLALPAPPKAELSLPEWALRTGSVADAVDERVRTFVNELNELNELNEVNGAGTADGTGEAGGGVVQEYRRAADRLEQALAGVVDGERPTQIRPASMRLVDVLVTRCVELIVHTDDLNAATGLELPYDRQALAATTRALADALAVKAPGGAVEVRIPPFAVVQCVEGPRHTRGTPPNVVETDPLTWARLATGRLAWAPAVDAARVAASGERADLTELLPVLS